MKKREVTPEELKEIIAYRKLGTTWTKIEEKTKVERRAAKRAYTEWKIDEDVSEQDALRFRINAEAWNEHMNDLVSLSSGLVSKLRLPPKLVDLEKNSKQFFISLWGEDLLNRYLSPETGSKIYPGDLDTYGREQELLFEALKVHTKGKVRWEALDTDWKDARDKCVDIIPKLKKEISSVVGKLILQPKMVKSIEDLTNLLPKGVDPQQRIEKVMLTQLWQRINLDKLDSDNPRFEIEDSNGKTLVISRDFDLRDRDETIFPFFNVKNQGLANNIAQLCNSSFDILIKSKEVQSLYYQVTNIKKAHQELAEMLIPVKLKPVIRHSKCNLCPL